MTRGEKGLLINPQTRKRHVRALARNKPEDILGSTWVGAEREAARVVDRIRSERESSLLTTYWFSRKPYIYFPSEFVHLLDHTPCQHQRRVVLSLLLLLLLLYYSQA